MWGRNILGAREVVLVMLTLALVGLVSGLITAVSPCVLPVLPAILTAGLPTTPLAGAGTTTGGGGTPLAAAPVSRWRPIAIVGGLVSSFAVFTLVGGSLVSALRLPADALRWAGVIVLAVVGLGFLVPVLGETMARPFQRVRLPEAWRARMAKGNSGIGGAYGVGAALGLVFVPCAGPVLGAITILAATSAWSFGLIVLTIAFSVGVAIPLLGFALAGQGIVARIRSVRTHLGLARRISGAVLIATAVVIATNVLEPLQRAVPTALADAQSALEDNDAVRAELDRLGGRSSNPGASPDVSASSSLGAVMSFDDCEANISVLQNCGPARDFADIDTWINTADGQALTMAELRGQVVLIDFWTYSCINCQRTFPYLKAWNDRYADDGLVIVGVHSPEFAFEKVPANVADAAGRFGLTYPIALDNNLGTWSAWDQRYWPAHYLVDRDGVVRQVHYGEGGYAETELLIQELLDTAESPVFTAPTSGDTPGRSPETYLGSRRLQGYFNTSGESGVAYDFTIEADPPRDVPTLGGTWTIDDEFALAGEHAVMAYRFRAADVHLVMGGSGTVRVTRAGDPSWVAEFEVSGTPMLYTLYSGEAVEDLMTIEFEAGVEAYAFTFG